MDQRDGPSPPPRCPAVETPEQSTFRSRHPGVHEINPSATKDHRETDGSDEWGRRQVHLRLVRIQVADGQQLQPTGGDHSPPPPTTAADRTRQQVPSGPRSGPDQTHPGPDLGPDQARGVPLPRCSAVAAAAVLLPGPRRPDHLLLAEPHRHGPSPANHRVEVAAPPRSLTRCSGGSRHRSWTRSQAARSQIGRAHV